MVTTIKSLEKVVNELSGQLMKFQTMIMKELKDVKLEMKADYSKSINLFEETIKKHVDLKVGPITKSLNDMELRVSEVEAQLKDLRQHDEVNKRKNNLLISGIAPSEDENLSTIVKNISSKLGFAHPPNIFASRIPTQDPSRSQIRIKFETPDIMRSFFAAYFKAKLLTQKEIICGSSSTSRIYINEDLTKANYEFLRAANKLKKERKLAFVRIINGYVGVKKSTDINERFTIIKSAAQLNIF